MVSAIASVVAFHPAVFQNGREPTWAAQYLWTRHQAWNNPLPEVFIEANIRTESPLTPVFTGGCEKILIGQHGSSPAWPLPCYLAEIPAFCRRLGAWCYANREAAGYAFARAPGRWNRPPETDTRVIWPADALPAVRRFYGEWEWWNLRQHAPRPSWLIDARGVRVAVLDGPDRFILVLSEPEENAALTLRLHGLMSGVLADAMTGTTLEPLQFTGAAGEDWEVRLPPGPPLQLLAMRRSGGGR